MSTEVQALPAQPITLTDQALDHLRKLRAEHGQASDLLLRVGVRSGGCSGMSYAMDFESSDNVQKEDCVMEYAEGFRLVCDPKSLLYLFGMQVGVRAQLVFVHELWQKPAGAACTHDRPHICAAQIQQYAAEQDGHAGCAETVMPMSVLPCRWTTHRL